MKRILQSCLLILALSAWVQAARYTTLTFTSASVAAGGSITTNRSITGSYINVYKVKAVPSLAGTTSRIQIYKKDTYLAADLIYDSGTFSGTYVDPRERTTGTERNEGFVVPYEDLDATLELHIKITNNHTQARTYGVTIEYEEPATASSTPTFTAVGIGTGPAASGLKLGSGENVELAGTGAIKGGTGDSYAKGKWGVGTDTPTATLTLAGSAVQNEVTISEAGAGPYTFATDATLANKFLIQTVSAHNFTLSNPTGAYHGQVLQYWINQPASGTPTVMTLDTKFAYGTDITGVTLSLTVGKTDKMIVEYNSTADKFRVIGFVKGY